MTLTSSPPPRWFARWRRAAPRRIADDPADMGTAFGLEMTLDVPAPAVAKPVRRPAAGSAAPARAGWVKRLALRRKTGEG